MSSTVPRAEPPVIKIRRSPRLQNPKSYLEIIAMLLPNLILVSVFIIYPFIWTIKFMFFSYDGTFGSEPEFVAMDNFVRIFTRDRQFWSSVWNTFIYAFGKIALVIPVSFLIAMLLNRKKRGDSVLQALVFLPTIMSSAVMALVFYLLFNAYNGEINRFLIWIGALKSPLDWLDMQHAMLTCILVAFWGGLGNYMVYFLAGLQGIPTELYESASIDGVNKFQSMSHITLPMLGPVLKVILMLSIINAFNDMGSILVLTGGGPVDATMVMMLYGYQFFFPISAGMMVSSQFGYGATVSMVSAMIIGLVTVSYLVASRKLDEIAE